MKRRIILSLNFIAFFAMCSICHGQICSTYTGCRPIPKMLVEKPSEDLWKSQFKKGSLFRRSKYKMLEKDNGTQDLSIFFVRSAMDDLIHKFENLKGYRGIRVYFARYNLNLCNMTGTMPVLPPNKLILLFSPVGAGAADTNYYYINENDPNLYLVSDTCANSWIDDYDKSNMKSLRKTIRTKDLDNYPGRDKTQEFSDTKFVFYNADPIHDAFVCEPQYQQTKGITITGYEVSFSAYTKSGKIPGDFDSYKKRMFIQFDYMNKVNGKDEIFYLDEQPEYPCRKANTITSKGLDNGQLCPTYCQ